MEEITFENILSEVGDSQLYQHLLVWVFLMPLNFILPWLEMGSIFLSSTPDHWCNVPGRPNYTSVEEWKNFSIPLVLKDGVQQFSKCEQYNLTSVVFTDEFTDLGNDSRSVIDCQNGWQYDHTDYEETVSTLGNWVCGREHLKASWLSIGVAGYVVGTLMLTSFADIIGRRQVFVTAIVLRVVFGVARLFVTSYGMLMFLQFLSFLSMGPIIDIPLITVLEQVSTHWRARIMSLSFIFWTFGNCLLPVLAWLARDWIALGLILSVPFSIFLFSWWLLPDSPRWLISKGRIEEAVAALQKIAITNGREIPAKLEEQIRIFAGNHKVENNYGVVQVFMHRRVMIRFLLITVCTICNHMIFHGLSYNVSNMSGNEFLNFFYLAAVEIPGNLVGWWATDYIGRRWTKVSALMTGSVLIFIASSTTGNAIVNSLLMTTAKFFCIISFLSTFLYFSEMFPTTHRAASCGLAFTISGSFGVTAPYVSYAAVHGSWVPPIILGFIGVVGTISASFLPETKDQDLPQNLQDADQFLADHKFWSYKGKIPCRNENTN